MERFEEVFKAAIQGMHQENVKAYGSTLANVLLPALEALKPVFKATYDQGVEDEQAKLEGCVVVPVEPTEAMYLAGVEARNDNCSTLDVWTAMVEAARGGK